MKVIIWRSLLLKPWCPRSFWLFYTLNKPTLTQHQLKRSNPLLWLFVGEQLQGKRRQRRVLQRSKSAPRFNCGHQQCSKKKKTRIQERGQAQSKGSWLDIFWLSPLMSFHPSSPKPLYTPFTQTHFQFLLQPSTSLFSHSSASFSYTLLSSPPNIPSLPPTHTPCIQPSFIEGVQRDQRAAHTDNINVLSFLQPPSSDSGKNIYIH